MADYINDNEIPVFLINGFLEAGKELLVSPYHLASRCKQEQGKNGTSPLITGSYNSYEGYYNYFNIGAYTTSTASASVNSSATSSRTGMIRSTRPTD